MQALRRSRFLRHVMLPLMLMAWLSGCYKWSRPAMPLDQALSEREAEKVRLKLSDGREVRLKSPKVVGDSVVEVTPFGGYRAVALDDVIWFEVQNVEALKTIGVVATVLGSVALVVASFVTTSKLGDFGR